MNKPITSAILCSLASVLLSGCVASRSTPVPRGGLVLPARGGDVVVDATSFGAVLGPFSSLNDNCTLQSNARVQILKQPENGTVRINQSAGNPGFPADSSFAKCNGKKVRGTFVEYKPRAGYSGPETFQFVVVFSDGERRILTPTLNVQQ